MQTKKNNKAKVSTVHTPINLSLNESSVSQLQFSPALLKKIATMQMNVYPTDELYQSLEKSVAKHLYNVPASKVLCCNGSDDGIFLLMQRFALPHRDKPILLLAPTFSMYHHYAAVLGISLVEIKLDDHFYPPIASLKRQIKEVNPSMIFLPNPLAPTGAGVLPEDVKQLLSEVKDSVLVVDEAYIEFSSLPSHIKALASHPRLVILRTLSKFYGLAALRVGFILSHHRDELRKIQAPFSLSTLSVELAKYVVEKNAKKQTQLLKKQTLANREKIRKALESSSFVQQVGASDANFLFVITLSDHQAFREFLKKEGGFYVKNLSAQYANSMRIGIPSSADTTRLVKLIKDFDQKMARR